jgi:chromosome segregation ATPase
MRWPVLIPALALAAGCTASQDPAEGGFVSGVQNLSDGTYEKRVEEKEAAVAAGAAQTTALEGEKAGVAAETAEVEAQIAAAEGDLAAAKREIIRLRYELEAAQKPVPPEVQARVEAAAIAAPTGPDNAAKLAALRQAIADTRALAEELTRLAS